METLNVNSRSRQQVDKFCSIMPNNVVVTQSYLRDLTLLTQTVALSTNQIQFTMTASGGGGVAPVQLAQRLKNNDSFLVTEIGFFIGFAANTTTAASTAAQIQGTVDHTFPTSTVMRAADIPSLQGIYNGFLLIKVDSTTYFEALPMYQFYRVGPAQQGVLYINAQTTTGIVRSEWDGKNYGFIPLEGREFRMAGNKAYTVTINIQSTVAFEAIATTSGGGSVYADLWFRGYLATGGWSYINK